MKKYIISGMKPGVGGTGDFVDYLLSINTNKKFNYELLTPDNKFSLPKNWILRKATALSRRIRKRLFYDNDWQIFENSVFYNKVSKIQDSDIILLHPQTLGFKILLNLIKNGNRIMYYVLDNSFFCVQSYNYHSNEQECLRCLGFQQTPFYDCNPFPVLTSRAKMLEHMKEFKELSKKIHFFTQNSNQLEMIKKHFGQDTNVETVGMWTKSLEMLKDKPKINITKRNIKPRIVYHASNIDPKGYSYFIELAKRLPQFEFVLPITPYSLITNFPSNLYSTIMTWENGLMDLIQNSELTICPSLWSAANEAALIKSILFAPKVAVIELLFGFEGTLPQSFLLRLNKNVTIGIEQIIEYFRNPIVNDPDEVDNWINLYKSNCQIDKLFIK
ncbi:MAG: hypothetical protein SFU98_14980 [Leptospiraceae bacterium]|nr:hypothetical protein [Leptospiraceae bacterium]